MLLLKHLFFQSQLGELKVVLRLDDLVIQCLHSFEDSPLALGLRKGCLSLHFICLQEWLVLLHSGDTLVHSHHVVLGRLQLRGPQEQLIPLLALGDRESLGLFLSEHHEGVGGIDLEMSLQLLDLLFGLSAPHLLAAASLTVYKEIRTAAAAGCPPESAGDLDGVTESIMSVWFLGCVS